MTDPTPQDVQRYIADGLTCDHLEVEGDGRHFFATIVSAEFEGLMRIRRHQRHSGPAPAGGRAIGSLQCRSL